MLRLWVKTFREAVLSICLPDCTYFQIQKCVKEISTSCFPADIKSVYKKIQPAFNRMNNSSFGCLWECPQLLELCGTLVDTSKLDSNINSVVNVVTHS